ncbi:MAG: signal recognition particle protein [Spirochaetales bacterium]|nr:signal recognition particle protein [Spirochaetales bacterium]
MLERLSNKLIDVVRHISGKAAISEKNIQDAVEEIKLALLEADVNLRVVRRFVNGIIEEALGAEVVRGVNPGQQFIKLVHDRIIGLLGEKKADLNLKGPDTHSVILLLGMQGSGKTTSAAKLGSTLKKQGRNVLLVAADLVRPAAAEQLALLGQQAGIAVYREESSKPLEVVKNALRKAKKELFNTVIIDTSGRLEIDEPMMKEIEEIKKVSSPDEVLLVADAMTGQHAVEIAKTFNERVGLTGVMLSKFDSDTRGGAALSIKSITQTPIKFIGVGEKLDDLDPFYPERIASRILGMGDVVSLVEKAEQTIQQDEALELQKKIDDKTFDLEDYLDQFRRVKKMGNLQSLVEMIPGLKGNIDEDKIDVKEMTREEAIILSMTRMERKNPRIIGPTRRKRIANGSGTAVFDVNKLLKKFDKTKNMMRKMSRNKDYQQQLMNSFGQ